MQSRNERKKLGLISYLDAVGAVNQYGAKSAGQLVAKSTAKNA
jgi:hypothetical protein